MGVRAAVRGSRRGDTDARDARRGAGLRALGGSPDVDATLLARYPDSTRSSNREAIEVDDQAEVAGATIYVDFERAGTSPLAARAAARART